MATAPSPITYSKQLNAVPGDAGVKVALVLGFSLASLFAKEPFRESGILAVGILAALASIFYLTYVSLWTNVWLKHNFNGLKVYYHRGLSSMVPSFKSISWSTTCFIYGLVFRLSVCYWRSSSRI